MIVVLRIGLIISLVIFIRLAISKMIAKVARNYFYDDKNNGVFLVELMRKYKKNIYIFSVGCLTFICALLNGYTFTKSCLFVVSVIILLITYKKIRQKAIKKEILCDLLNVAECLRVQISSQIPLETAFRSLGELCKNKVFSNMLKNLYLEYTLYKFTISNAGEELQRIFNYSEIRMFVSALKQQNQHTSMIELLDNLIDVLREEYIEFLEDATKSKMAIMTMGVFLIVVNIALIGVYPVFVESFSAINMMFD